MTRTFLGIKQNLTCAHAELKQRENCRTRLRILQGGVDRVKGVGLPVEGE